LIRTGDEKRISNFLLWQIAYAEIIFEPTYWPEYNEQIFNKNLLEYSKRSRHFGKIN
jgi:undecaprenyl diphosphate synthase